MIIAAARRFFAGLLPREKANYSLEDIISELWILVREKDHKWNPETGAYTTFAMLVMKHHFDDLRAGCRTVHAPRNAASRIREHEGAGKPDSQTVTDIRRSMREPLPLKTSHEKECPSAADEAVRHEEDDNSNARMEAALPGLAGRLGRRGSRLVQRVLGVGGHTPHTVQEAAEKLGMTMAEANDIAARGQFAVAQSMAPQ